MFNKFLILLISTVIVVGLIPIFMLTVAHSTLEWITIK